jgi:endonuclease/exonuclease/phosphatase family metal-dependent hydrolase
VVKTRHPVAAALALVLAATACHTGVNYVDAERPRYTRAAPAGTTTHTLTTTRTLRIASFNIERAMRVDTAVAVMEAHPELRDADVLLLQEMDDRGAQRVAEALGMGYVYYPGTLSLKTHRDFGNAVLSRWPIVEDAKILLPHLGLVGRLQRTATAATLDVDGTRVRVYSVHLGTMINVTAGARRGQLQTVITDAETYPHVVLGGDLNSHGVGTVAVEHGFAWPTKDGPPTTRLGRWDHIFLKGLSRPGSADAGTVLDVQGASDHRAVWAVGILPIVKADGSRP